MAIPRLITPELCQELADLAQKSINDEEKFFGTGWQAAPRFQHKDYTLGVDVANGEDYTVVFGTVDGIVFENLGVIKPKKPPMRNVTPPKPKLLKESNE